MKTEDLYRIFTEHPQVTTDSRDCPSGSIFFALKGTSFDGNAYAEMALEKGCAYAVIDEKQYDKEEDGRLILVDDCLKALQDLARHHRRQLGTKIIGVTGTNGKTTTKELIAAVLAEKYNVLYTSGNFNNHIGVPKTLLRLTPEHEMAVVEMGANHPGEIKILANIVEPDFGIITNVGKAHLEGFGSFEGVVKTKGELYDYLRTKKDGTVFIHNENEYLMSIAHGLKLIRYGLANRNDLCAHGRIMDCAPFLTFKWRHGAGEWNEVETRLIGDYNIHNMLAAACIGLTFGISQEQINHALSHYIPQNNRSQLDVTAHNKLIVDAYNANPTSLAAAIKNFRNMAVAPKMAIIGDMRELGATSREEHQQVADLLKEANIDKVWLVGEEFGKTQSGFRKFKDVEEVKAAVREDCPQGFYILIKGSNGMRLSQLPESL